MAGAGGRGGGGGRNGALPAIPPSAMKIVKSLREIVSCPDAEIYTMLLDCNMDPDEAVQRLLSQDTFHEVKSKREKKKEVKEIPESRPWAVSTSSNRGSRVGVDRGGHSTSSQFSSVDSGVGRGKPAKKKENGTIALPTSSVLGPSMAGNNLTQKSTSVSRVALFGSTVEATGIDYGTSSSLQPSAGFQHNWIGKPGQVSMADIVKMGRPQGKPFSTSFVPSGTSCTSHSGVIPRMSQDNTSHSPWPMLPSESDAKFNSSQGPVSVTTEISHEVGNVGHCVPNSDRSLAEESSAINESTIPETSGTSASYVDPLRSYTLHVDEVVMQRNPHLDEARVLDGNITGESKSEVNTTSASASASNGQIGVDNPVTDSRMESAPVKTMSSYQSQRHAFEHEEVENADVEISSAVENLHKLRLHKEELAATSAGDSPAVIIPSHLQSINADFSHLCFGSFGSGISATISGSYPSKPVQTNSEVAPVADVSSLDHSDSRNVDYDNEQLQYISNENVASRVVTNTKNYDMPSASQPDVSRNDSLDAAEGNQFKPTSSPGYPFSTTIQPNAATSMYPQANIQLQQYTNSSPSSLLAQSVPLREFDLPFSPLLSTQSVPAKYSTAMSTVSGPAISPPEVEPRVFSTPQQTPQTLLGPSIPAGLGLPQHLSFQSYSQSALPLGHFANVISYPLLPPSYTYLPSAAFQQAYVGNGPFHQSPAALHSANMKYTLPQYKSSVSAAGLPQAASVASGYGGFGISTNIPGGFPLNSSMAVASPTIGFDEALRVQYKGNHYLPHQQAENSVWVHGAGLRTASALPSDSFYSFRGQNQPGGYRQQPSNFGAMEYLNMFHLQPGAAQEHHNPSEGNMNGSQGQSQQSHQIWQHGY